MKMFQRILVFLLILTLVPAVTASADMGPKPSTYVFVGTEYDAPPFVMTLLAEEEHSGPHDTVEKDREPDRDMRDGETEAFVAFRDYEDPDGFHFWGYMDHNQMKWGYYPPEVFKVALYFPEYDSLIVSGESYERYAFESSFHVWLTDVDLTKSGTVSMELEPQEPELGEILPGLAFRAAVTVVLELGLALLWGYREKKSRLTVLCVNLLTQAVLNALLWNWYYISGPWNAMAGLVLGELVVLIVEIGAYRLLLPGKGSRATLYALCANILSCGLGWVLLDGF